MYITIYRLYIYKTIAYKHSIQRIYNFVRQVETQTGIKKLIDRKEHV